jgi:hypothetical protein
MRVQSLFSLAAISLLITSFAASSASLQIDDPRWAQLSRVDQNKIIQELKDKGALDPDDSIAYNGPTPDSKQTDLSLRQIKSIAAVVVPVICAAKVAYNKYQCEQRPTNSDKAQCLHDAEEKAQLLSSICSVFN